MTYTVIARDPQDNALGICLATSPLGVASRCPHLRPGVGAISSQCHSNPKLGMLGLDMLSNDVHPEQILEMLRSYDRHFDYRQVGIVSINGEIAVHSGANGKAYTGHMTGKDFIVMGNGLASRKVVEAMYEAYGGSSGEAFEERLMLTIEAGFAAGGEPIGQRSAGMIVGAPGGRPRVDLRVGVTPVPPENGGDAVIELRRVFDAYRPLIPYYSSFWPDNPEVQWTEWLEREAS